MTIRQDRFKDRIKSLTAKYLASASSRQSLITVTDCLLSKDNKQATILISVLPESEERPALSFTKHKLSELRDYIRQNSDLRILPYLSVEIDYGEKNRHKIDQIIQADKDRQ